MSRTNEDLEDLFVSGKKKGSKSMLFKGKKMRLLFLLVFGIVIGVVIGHYLVEPLLSESFYDKFIECESRYSLLDEEVNQCYLELNECDGKSGG